MDPTEADNSYNQGGYVTCPKCGVEHSTLVKHRCFKPKKQEEKPKFDDNQPDGDCQSGGGGGETGGDNGQDGTDGPDGQSDGQDGKNGQDGESQSDGQGQSDGQDGDSEPKNGKGQKQKDDGDDEDDGEGGKQAPHPQPPQPKAPPVVIVCTVLKFAALTAQCAKNGNIEITLAEDGLFVYGHNGETVAYDVIPWGELEERATLDGEFYVKGVIDEVDRKLADTRKEMIAKIAAIPEAPIPETPEEPPEEKPALTLPLTIGQRVVRHSGPGGRLNVRVVTAIEQSAHREDDDSIKLARFDDGIVVYEMTGKVDDNGKDGKASIGLGGYFDVVRDATDDEADGSEVTLEKPKARARKAKTKKA